MSSLAYRPPVAAALLLASAIVAAGCHLLAGSGDFNDQRHEAAGAAGGAGGSGGPGGATSSTGSGDHVWSQRFGGDGDESANISADALGNAHVGCRFQSDIAFGRITLSAEVGAGELDGCAAELDPDGNPVAAVAFGAQRTGATYWPPVADGAGNVFLSTTFEGDADFGGLVVGSQMGLDAGIGKVSAAGGQWASTFVGNGDTQILAIAPLEGGMLAAGAFEGDIYSSTGTTEDVASNGAIDVWVSKVDSRGLPIWLRAYGGPGLDGAYGIAPTADGGMVIIGGFEQTMSFGTASITSAGSFDGFLAKLDENGDHVWSKAFGDAEGFIWLSLAVDASNDEIAIVLGTTQTVDFGGGPLEGSGGFDVVVARLDAAGGHLWSQRWGDVGEQSGVSVAAAGGVTVVGGDFEGTLDAGGGALTSAGGKDVFVAKLDREGHHVWSHRFGDAENQTLGSVAMGPELEVLLAGAFAGTIDFGGGPLTATGSGTDIFVAKLGP